MAHFIRPRPRSFSPALALVLGVGLAAALSVLFIITTGWIFTALVTVACALAVLGAVHYLLWGESLERATGGPRNVAVIEEARQPPADTFTLNLTDRERAELLRLLDTRAGVAGQADEGARRGLADKIRDFGA